MTAAVERMASTGVDYIKIGFFVASADFRLHQSVDKH